MRRMLESLLLVLVVAATILGCTPKLRCLQDRDYYVHYIATYRNGPKVEAAQWQLQELDWKYAESLCTLDAYMSYVQTYPESDHLEIARQRISLLEDLATARESHSLTEWINTAKKNGVDHARLERPTDSDQKAMSVFRAELDDYLKTLTYRTRVTIGGSLLVTKPSDIDRIYGTVDSVFCQAISRLGYQRGYDGSDVVVSIGYEEYIGSRVEVVTEEKPGSIDGVAYVETSNAQYYRTAVPCARVQITLECEGRVVCQRQIGNIAPISNSERPKEPIAFTMNIYGAHGASTYRSTYGESAPENYSLDYKGMALRDDLGQIPIILWGD
jgi:RNase P/RNase MRP subunit p29